MIPTLAVFVRAQSRALERSLRVRDAVDAANGYYGEADKVHEAGNFARERYARYWGDRTATEAA